MSALALPRSPSGHVGLGSWSSVLSVSLQAGMALATMSYQAKLAKQAQHDQERAAAAEREHQLAMARAAAAAAKAQQEQLAAEATGGAVALDAHGNPINPAGFLSAGAPGQVRKTGMLMLGVAAVGVVGILAIGALSRRGRRRRR